MAEISYYEADLREALEKLNDEMAKYNKLPPSAKKNEILANADLKIQEIIELKKGYQLALRQAPRHEAKEYRQKFEEYAAKVEQLTEEVKWAKTEQERSGLFGDRRISNRLMTPGAAINARLTNDDMLSRATAIQTKTEASLMNTQNMVNASKDVAIATGEKLREQRQQIADITDVAIGMENDLQRADKLLRTFARRLATDRVILLYAFLIFIGIAAIVVYKAMYPEDSTFYVPDEVTPPNPVALYNKTIILVNQTVISINNP